MLIFLHCRLNRDDTMIKMFKGKVHCVFVLILILVAVEPAVLMRHCDPSTIVSLSKT